MNRADLRIKIKASLLLEHSFLARKGHRVRNCKVRNYTVRNCTFRNCTVSNYTLERGGTRRRKRKRLVFRRKITVSSFLLKLIYNTGLNLVLKNIRKNYPTQPYITTTHEFLLGVPQKGPWPEGLRHSFSYYRPKVDMPFWVKCVEPPVVFIFQRK